MEIGKCLADIHHHRTLANLNVCCRQFRYETLQLLFRQVIWEQEGRPWVFDGGFVPEGWQFTE